MVSKCHYCGEVTQVQVVASSRTGAGKTVMPIYSCTRCIKEAAPRRR